jgi:hypothetical protein
MILAIEYGAPVLVHPHIGGVSRADDDYQRGTNVEETYRHARTTVERRRHDLAGIVTSIDSGNV